MANIIQINLNKLLVGTPYESRRVVGVALSGGRDSVALCHALVGAGENVVALNVEHGIRGEASKRDSAFVAEFCKAQGVKLYSFSVDAPAYAKQKGYTMEQAARELRYRVFDKALSDGLCDVIALAHHADDQAETILMRILRGTGTKGLVGMKVVSGRYIRPLLKYSRDDINDYVKAHDLSYVEDETNDDTAYSRNFLRQELARLKERYPDLENSFARLSRVASETEDCIESILPKLEVKDGEVLIKTVDCANSFILKRLVLKGAELLGVHADIEEKHLNCVVELASNETGKRIDLTHGLVAHKDARGIVLAKKSCCDSDEDLPFGIGVFQAFGVAVKEVNDLESVDLKSGRTLFADYDKFPQGAIIRTRRDGDCILKFGGGRKSLGDFLTDKKIPLRLRDGLKVVAKDDEVFAIFGVEISQKVKITKDTRRAVELEVLK